MPDSAFREHPRIPYEIDQFATMFALFRIWRKTEICFIWYEIIFYDMSIMMSTIICTFRDTSGER